MKEGWTYKKLGEVCEILDSRRKPITKSKRETGTIPYYGATGLLDYVKDYIFDERLVLLGEDGAKWGSGENSSYIIEGKSWVNNHAHVLRPKRDILVDELLVYYLNFSNLLPYITGVTVPKLNQEKMRSIEIPIGPIDDQLSIVSNLDAAFAHIDSLKANAEKQLVEARQLFQAELAECMKPKEGWEEKSFVNCIDKVPKQKQVKSKDYKSFGNYPIVSQEKELISGYWDDDSYLYKHERPIIIFGDHTKEIKYVDFNFVVGADGTQILSPKKGIDARFFYYALVATPLRTLGYARHFKLLKEKTFFIPPLDTQDQIVFRLDALSANIKKLEEVQRKTLAECDALKQAMLREVFE